MTNSIIGPLLRYLPLIEEWEMFICVLDCICSLIFGTVIFRLRFISHMTIRLWYVLINVGVLFWSGLFCKVLSCCTYLKVFAHNKTSYY